MCCNALKLNPDKTELLVVGKPAEVWLELFWPPEMGSPPALSVKSLDLTVDADLSRAAQVNKVCRTCIGLMRSLRKLVPLLSRPVLRTVVSAIILPQLDYLGLPASSLAKLQVIQNDASKMTQPVRI